MRECINSNWNVRELQRQRTTLLYEKLINSKDKDKLLELSTKGHSIKENKDIIIFYLFHNTVDKITILC